MEKGLEAICSHMVRGLDRAGKPRKRESSVLVRPWSVRLRKSCLRQLLPLWEGAAEGGGHRRAVRVARAAGPGAGTVK